MLLVSLGGCRLIRRLFPGFQPLNDLIRKLATYHFCPSPFDELGRLKIGQTDDPLAAFGEKEKSPRRWPIA